MTNNQKALIVLAIVTFGGSVESILTMWGI